MSQLVADCPRCRTINVAFKALVSVKVGDGGFRGREWQKTYDVFCVCSHCDQTTVFILLPQGPSVSKTPTDLTSVNSQYKIEGYRSLKDAVAAVPPEHLPPTVDAAFREGATCISVKCYNAGATMFRMCLDIATKQLLPTPTPSSLTPHIQRNLGPRLGWLLDNGILPEVLRELSQCVKDDGNDGAHDGTLGKVDTEDLMDFTFLLLERLYTEPKRLELAAARRVQRHAPNT